VAVLTLSATDMLGVRHYASRRTQIASI